MRIHLFFGVPFLLLAFSLQARGNLLSNAGFDDGSGPEASNWSRFDQSGRQTWAARSGAAGGALYGWVSNNWGGLWQDVPGQSGNTWYVFSSYARAETNFNAESVCLKLEWFDANTSKLSETEYETGQQLNSSWQQFTLMAQSPVSTRMVRVVMAGWVFHPPGGATEQMACLFDDTSLATTNMVDPVPDITLAGSTPDQRFSLSWAPYRRRHEAVWRSVDAECWQPTYSASIQQDSDIVTWDDTEHWNNSRMLYRVSRGEELVPGTTVKCTAEGSTGVTYARFLPHAFTPQGTNPLVIALDPNGGGSYMVSVLRHSAEKYGWIVVGCDTIQNGSDWLDDRRFYEILQDVRRRIPHDERRLYVAGFSGGAYRGFEHVRYFWNEFAGLITYGGWIGNYDDYTVFPSRLAVARLRGDTDEGSASWDGADAGYILGSGCSLRDWIFPGGHQTAPPAWTDEAVAWLNEDFETNGVRYIGTNHVATVPSAFSRIKAACRTGAWQEASTQTVSMMHYYPFSWEAHQGEEVLVDIFSESSQWAQVAFNLQYPLSGRQSWSYMSRALIVPGGFPANRMRALFELAVALDPSNAIACSYLSRILTETTPLSTDDLERATQLADTSIAVSNEYWRGWFARAWCASAAADYHSATGYIAQARDRAWRHPMGSDRYNQCEDASSYFEEHLP